MYLDEAVIMLQRNVYVPYRVEESVSSFSCELLKVVFNIFNVNKKFYLRSYIQVSRIYRHFKNEVDAL